MEKDFLKNVEESLRKTVSENCDGLLREMLLYHLSKQGKLLRPRMIQRLGKLLNAQEEDLLAWATCLELFHNASLIHDDLQDGDLYRRGQEAVWVKYGAKQAINAGDYMLMLSHKALEKIKDPSLRLKVQKIFNERASKIVQGQSLEFELNKLDGSLDPRQTYFRCIELKTASLFSCLAQGVAVLGKLEQAQRGELVELFSQLGVIFQLQDDILDLYGNKDREEKGCDLKEGKVSFLIIKHLELHPNNFSELKNLITKPRVQTSQEEVDAMSMIFIKNGVLASAAKELFLIANKTKESSILKRNSELSDLVNGLLYKILEPVSHVDDRFKEEARA